MPLAFKTKHFSIRKDCLQSNYAHPYSIVNNGHLAKAVLHLNRDNAQLFLMNMMLHVAS